MVKLLLIVSFVGIIYQDLKERKVYLWLLLISTFLAGFLHFQYSFISQFMASTLLNFGIILVILLILIFYAKFKLKKPIGETFGIGDLMFFITIAVAFPTITFVVLFSFSLFFSLLLYLFLKKQLVHKTVPLAGLQAVFFSLIFLLNWSFNFVSLYQY